MKQNIKKILVTGGAGFIGSHTVDLLLENGYQVVALDSLKPPTHNGKIPIWFSKKAKLIRGDVREKKDWQKTLRGVDAIVHLAAYMDYHPDFSTYVQTNIESLAILFEIIAEEKLPIKKIVVASSQAVYGEGKYRCKNHGVIYVSPREEEQFKRHQWEQYCPKCGKEVVPISEKEDDILLPLAPYGLSKLASEQFVMAMGRAFSIPAVALRFSIVLGARQSFRHFYSGALRSFAVNALNNEPIAMNEDGGQLRDFIHVKDVASAIAKTLEDNRANFKAFNVGSGQATRIFDLAKIVAKQNEVAFKPSLQNRYRVGGTRHSVMNISKLKGLGWKPKRPLKEAVADYINWLSNFRGFNRNLRKTEEKMRKSGILKKY